MSFAVIKTGGKQYRVSEGDKVLVEKLEQEVGKEFDFEEVLLVGRPAAEVDTGVEHSSLPDLQSRPETGQRPAKLQPRHWDAKIGTPLVDGAKVTVRVLEQGRAKKKIVFKFHHKTRYKKKKGHRQPFTKIEILKISA